MNLLLYFVHGIDSFNYRGPFTNDSYLFLHPFHEFVPDKHRGIVQRNVRTQLFYTNHTQFFKSKGTMWTRFKIQCIIHKPYSTCHKVALAKPTTRLNLKHFTVNQRRKKRVESMPTNLPLLLPLHNSTVFVVRGCRSSIVADHTQTMGCLNTPCPHIDLCLHSQENCLKINGQNMVL